MRRVAQAVRITPMAIYHYFPTREALLRAVVQREFGAFLDLIGQQPIWDTVEAQIEHALDAYLEYALTRPEVFDYVFGRPREDARRFPEDFRARRSPTLNLLADAIAVQMQAGRLRQDDVWEVTMDLWAHAHGYIALRRAGRFNATDAEFKALVHRSMRRLYHGLKA